MVANSEAKMCPDNEAVANDLQESLKEESLFPEGYFFFYNFIDFSCILIVPLYHFHQ